ncbi:amine dehydrogenase [Ectopseudomonas mendocina NK-01]|nr:amine dehydrogenase [Pseudomonas mendocina NK-01]
MRLHPHDSEEPLYQPNNDNDVNWCLAAKSHIYHCTASIIRGVAI